MSIDENDLKDEFEDFDQVQWATPGGIIGRGTIISTLEQKKIAIIAVNMPEGELRPVVYADYTIITKLKEG